MARILITGAGGPAGSALGRQLAGSEHHVVGADMVAPQPHIEALFDEVVRVPRADSPAFLPAVRELVRRERIDLVIPTVQEELPLFAGAGSLLGARVVISPIEGVWRAQDKLLTMWALERAGASVPAYLALEDAGPVVPGRGPAAWSGGFPLVVKPRTSRGGRGVRVIDTPEQWTAELVAEPGQIVQGFADGAEYAVQLFVPARGAVTAVVLEKTALKEGRVGNAAGVRRAHDRDVAQVAIDAVRALGLVGPLDVDVRRDASGTPLVLEVNARFGANSAHAPELLAGVLAEHAAAVASASGPQPAGVPPGWGVPQESVRGAA